MEQQLKPITVSEAIELYRSNYIVFKNQSHKTEENHLICGRSFVAFTGDKLVTDITFEEIRDWKNYLAKTRSPATVRNYIIKLRVVLTFLRSHGYAVLDPATIPVPQRPDTVVTFLTREEVARIIEATPTLRGKAIISLLYGSGIRLSELLSLDRSQLIERSFTVVGKGGKARLCFIDDRSSFFIHEYLKTRTDNLQALFVSNYKHRMTATNVQLMVRTAAKRAGIDRSVSPHTLRHSFATDFTRNNGSMRHLQALMGHNSLETTAHYAHVVNPDLEASYRSFHTT